MEGEHMNVEEIVRALRKAQEDYKNDIVSTGRIRIDAMARDCADLIESLQDDVDAKNKYIIWASETIQSLKAENQKLDDEVDKWMKLEAASQRRERAAVEDLERYGRNIHTCDKATACTIVGQDHAACYDCPDWIWRGAQA
jgi:flagellar biosynthesis chaperone FliJ